MKFYSWLKVWSRLSWALRITDPFREPAADWPHNDVEVVNGTGRSSSSSRAAAQLTRLHVAVFCFPSEPGCFSFDSRKPHLRCGCFFVLHCGAIMLHFLEKRNSNLDRQIPASLCNELDNNYQRRIGHGGSVLGDNEADKGSGFTAPWC